MVRSLVRAFKSPAVRLRLAKLLAEAAKTHGNVLTYSQFSVLSKLVNKALQVHLIRMQCASSFLMYALCSM